MKKILEICIPIMLIFIGILIFNNNVVKADINSSQPFQSWNNGLSGYSYKNPVLNDGWKEPSDINTDTSLCNRTDYNSNNKISAIYKGTTAYVYDYEGFYNAIFKQGYGNGIDGHNDSSGVVSNIHKVVLENDINLDGTSGSKINGFGSSDYTANYAEHDKLVIDGYSNGNYHTLDMSKGDISIEALTSSEDWTIENMKILGYSYFGPISSYTPNGGTTLNYRNIDYYGAQLSWGSRQNNCKINIYGNVSVHSLDYYKDSSGQSQISEGQNQQNLQTGDIEFHKNSNYYGETYDGNCLELEGSCKIDNNVNIDLHPHGTYAEDAWFNSYGLYLYPGGNYKPEINFGSNDKFNIYCDSNNLTDSDGSSRIPEDPYNISIAIYANASSSVPANMYMNNGTNSKFNIYSNGQVKSQAALVYFSYVNANVSGVGNEFNVSSDANNSYIPSNGVVEFNGSGNNINVDNLGSFKLNIKNIPQTSTSNYQINSDSSTNINLDRPTDVEISNKTYNSNQNNHMFYSGTSNVSNNGYIYARNTRVTGWLGDNQTPSIDNQLVKSLFLPLRSDSSYGKSTIFVGGVRLYGSYFEVSDMVTKLDRQLVDSKSSDVYLKAQAKNYNSIKFTASPMATISYTNYNDYNKNNNKVTGKVIDDNGNPLKNSYINISLDNDKGKFIDPDTRPVNKNYNQYIASNEVLFSPVKQYMPSTSASTIIQDNGNTSNFYNNIAGTIGSTDGQFGLAHDYFYNRYNMGDANTLNQDITLYSRDGTTINKDSSKDEFYSGNVGDQGLQVGMEHYVAITDNNGNFSFNIPNVLWNEINNNNNNHKLNITPYYNFSPGNTKTVNLAYNPKLNINNKIKDITYSNADSSDGFSLSKVFQGGQGYSSQGDTLEFDSTINNTSDNSDISVNSSATYDQPLPNNIDVSTLKVSYDNNDFNVIHEPNVIKSNNGVKILKIPIKNLKSNSTLNLKVRGTLKNDNATVDNSDIRIKPKYNIDSTEYSGEADNVNEINFSDNQLNFTPISNIDYDYSSIVKDSLLLPTNSSTPVMSNVKNNMRGNSYADIQVQQPSEEFKDNSSSEIKGDLIYNGQNLNQSPVMLFSTDGNDNMYISNSTPLYLKPLQNYEGEGNDFYTLLNWSVTYGIN
ncbi:hypothetical protein MOO46_05345 [Apilactobacillus apisilvae]|uniref:Uncharacterized protein n=1 Tax=Apilactobacillus apisilvae TaxID=2923364 RepID=A0ABY4PGI7_9LACO|nr:hypothetical protein [Apilactobacillus apisilvae]UQS84675.1 hypothetical protein MOO46_05345 [Apilactobacillus apisilvae]